MNCTQPSLLLVFNLLGCMEAKFGNIENMLDARIFYLNKKGEVSYGPEIK